MDLFHSSRIDMKQQLNAGVSNEVNSGSVPFSAVEPVQRCNMHESSTPTLLELNEILINTTGNTCVSPIHVRMAAGKKKVFRESDCQIN